MRGKLRDKRSAPKSELFKREVIERRRPYKRDSQPISWLNQQLENEEDELDTAGEEDKEPEGGLPEKK